ncbi:MAG TPA: ABC transporter ATP-binding protein [Microbacterium sp.]|uniref:ABC transporter ATP-binding protein n=1 Tax=Microbacterium sp. TaxID=51671 RepID=UPI002CA3B612|nr:ABC transporter ATP-binding protein [Microbacterium sp.]HWI32295.1 ABC transporter ATP-binding protein [Microbacterium sp.]
MNVLTVDHLRLGTEHGVPVKDVSFSVGEGECVGIVGESGSGKSLTLRAIAGVLPVGVRVVSGEHDVNGRSAMVFQEPMTTLNPTMRVGEFIAEGPRARGVSKADSVRRAVELLTEVGVPDPATRARAWPHQLSGGLRQRVMIAAALAVEPAILLCDEPTTALDTTVQAQLLALVDRLRVERGMSVVFVSHNLAVVSRVAQRVIVMYAGRIVEAGPTSEILHHPAHPYTQALIAAIPTENERAGDLTTIAGAPPDASALIEGCSFAARCPLAQETCRTVLPPTVEVGRGHAAACHLVTPADREVLV